MERLEFERLSAEILDACIEVHRHMGPGLLESVYSHCLAREFSDRNISFDCQLEIPLRYKGRKLDKIFILDFLIADEIILELKSVELLLPVHEAQILSYMKLLDKRLGFLVNFNVPVLKNGFKRKVNNY